MTLPPADITFLAERELAPVQQEEAGVLCLAFADWTLPRGYDRASADLLIRLMPGYPDVAPDMWWFAPELRLASGGAVEATGPIETYLGRQWQRWSRHFQGGQWRSGIDGLESYIALINGELRRCGAQAA